MSDPEILDLYLDILDALALALYALHLFLKLPQERDGIDKGKILGMFLREALLLGILGGLVGITIAFGLIAIINRLPIYGGMLTPLWNLPIFLRALAIAFFLGLIGGIYPALRATRFQPVEALSYE